MLAQGFRVLSQNWSEHVRDNVLKPAPNHTWRALRVLQRESSVYQIATTTRGFRGKFQLSSIAESGTIFVAI